MAKEVFMPALGMAQETGTLLEWLAAEGAEVRKGEPLMTVATDKTDVDIDAPASGVLSNITAAPGDEIPVGQTIALILAPGESPADFAGSSKKADSAAEQAADPATEAAAPAGTVAAGPVAVSPVAARMAAEHNIDLASIRPAGGRIQKEDVQAAIDARATTVSQGASNGASQGASNGRIPASPKARRLAAEEGLALADINGSGPEGAVLAADVLNASAALAATRQPAAAAPTPPDTAETVPMSRMWRVMAERLTESWTSAPHFYLERDVDASGLAAWRERVQSRLDVKVTYTDLLVKLVAAALRQHPRLNASWLNNAIVPNDAINVGLAVAVEDGLLVPVLRGADGLGLAALASQREELVTGALAGTLSPDAFQGGTFTISNLGMFGVDRFNAIVNPPQAAILAVGRIAEQVVPVDGQPAVRPMMTLTLSCDHRVVDGARGAQFLRTLAEYIADPLAVLD